MLEFVDVLLVLRNVQYGCEWFGDLDRKLTLHRTTEETMIEQLYATSVLLPELHRWIETAGITRIESSVVGVSIDGHVNRCLIVVADTDCDSEQLATGDYAQPRNLPDSYVQQSCVVVANSTQVKIAMCVFRMNIDFFTREGTIKS